MVRWLDAKFEVTRDEMKRAEETKRGERAEQSSIQNHLGSRGVLTMMIVCLGAGRSQAARREQTSFACASALSQMEMAKAGEEQRQLFTMHPNELHDMKEKCSRLEQQVSALECQLDEAKSELEELEKERARQRARCWEAREAVQKYKFIVDEDEEPDEKTSSESDMDEEPRAK